MIFFCIKSSPKQGNGSSTCCLIVSIILFVISVIIFFGIDLIVSTILYSKLTLLQDNSELFDKWEKLPIPVGVKIWVFETSNPKEIWNGEKPILREKGPYVFSLWREKNILETNRNAGTIKYSEHNLYFFNQSQSIGPLEDNICLLNVPTVAFADKLGTIGEKLPLNGISLELIGNALFQAHKEELMTNMTVDEFLFKGQKVKILQTFENIWTPLSLLGIKFPSTGLKDNTYGLFYGQNSSFSEPLEIIGEGKKLGSVVAWKNEKKLSVWPGETCNIIRGTDGAIFSPFVKKDQIHLFIPDICRGIPGYRFTLSDQTFLNKDLYPTNECFCPIKGFPCNTDGVTSLGPCRANAPIYLSKPHFLSASSDLLDSVVGLKPNQSYQSFIDIEPTTGTPLRAKVQLQINVFVRRFNFIKTMSDIRKETLYPLVWFEQSAEINEELAQELITKLIKPLSYVTIFKYGSLIVTVSLFIFCSLWKCFSSKKTQPNDSMRKRQLRYPQNRTIGSLDGTIDQQRKRSIEAQNLYNLQKRGSNTHINRKSKTMKPFTINNR